MQVYQHQGMGEGWLTDRDGCWTVRFHRDERSWVRDRKLFVDYGREMPDAPALLKSRRYLREEDAKALWKALCSSGWVMREPAWGPEAEL